MKINKPFWKTNILIIDTLLQYIFIFCFTLLIHYLNTNHYNFIVIFCVITWIVYYIQSTYVLWNNNINDKTIRGLGNLGDNSGLLVWGWLGFIVLTLMIITSVNKQYNILSILLIIRILYQLADSTWACMYGGSTIIDYLGNESNIVIVFMVYILLIININTKQPLYYYPIVSTFVVFLSEVFRLMLAPTIGYKCL